MEEVFQASKKLRYVNSILPSRIYLALQQLSSVLYERKMDQEKLYFCHGDLHTGNISILKGTQEPIIFDQGVPNATLNDIYNGKTRIEKCSAETIYKIAKVLNVPMEDLIEEFIKEENAE